MFRKLLLSSVATLGVLSPLAFTGSADAREVCHVTRHTDTVRVYYREPRRHDWVFAASFHGRTEAVRCAKQYRCRGFEISIR